MANNNEVLPEGEDGSSRAVPASDGWRSIDSAPKDGTKIDLWVVFPESEAGEHRWADAFWNDEVGEWACGHYHAGQYVHRPAVTHWMPLPKAPGTAREVKPHPHPSNEQMIAELEAKLAPFADYADRGRLVPGDFEITKGSPLARRQLRMRDCYEAADLLDALRKARGEA